MGSRLVLTLSLGLNALVLAGLATLATWGWQPIVRSFLEPMREQRRSQFEVLPIESGDVVFLGDSITAGGNWNELFPGVPTRNRGIGGDTTGGVLERLDAVTRGSPARLFLKIGTNDLGTGVPEPEIVDNLRAILGRIRSASPDTRVYVQSVLPRAASYRAQVESLNAAFESVALNAGAAWIDLYPHFLAADGSIDDALSNDELHLLGAGYERWRDLLAAHVDDAGAAGRD